MDNSVEIAIEKIKHQEQDKEAKLKETRQFEATVMSLNRAIRDATLQVDKGNKEFLELAKTTTNLQVQVDVEHLHRSSLLAQLDVCDMELRNLRAESDQGVTTVWKLRTSLCETVQNVADECDVWALLMKPTCTDTSIRHAKKRPDHTKSALTNEGSLKTALERRKRALAERDRLLSEPEIGDEFIRIKNALRYSEEMAANMK